MPTMHSATQSCGLSQGLPASGVPHRHPTTPERPCRPQLPLQRAHAARVFAWTYLFDPRRTTPGPWSGAQGLAFPAALRAASGLRAGGGAADVGGAGGGGLAMLMTGALASSGAGPAGRLGVHATASVVPASQSNPMRLPITNPL